jgi:hypothetical protein
VARYIRPIVHALGSDFNYGNFTFLAGLLRTLLRSGDVECLMIAGSRFFARAALGRDGYSFDDQTGNRNQFEFLFDFLSSAPHDVGIIVTKYVEWGPFLQSCGPAWIRKALAAMGLARNLLAGADAVFQEQLGPFPQSTCGTMIAPLR